MCNLPILMIVIALLSPLAGCSTFQRDWDAMTKTDTAETGLAGRWEGTWLSDTNGHTGGLRCIISPAEGENFNARYRATYGWCSSFEYVIGMTTHADGETYRFDAEADLGWIAGGRYEYTGIVEGDEFTSTYSGGIDRGTFQMHRVK